MGMHYHGFGAPPTDEEKQHDYLWRVKRQLPQNGWIGIFDRPITRTSSCRASTARFREDQWRARYDEINTFEHDLVAGGCTILKIFLVSSKEEQKKHFLDRLDDPTKYWKFDPSDLEARERWDEYMDAWQEVFLRRPAPMTRPGTSFRRIIAGIPEPWRRNCFVSACAT